MSEEIRPLHESEIALNEAKREAALAEAEKYRQEARKAGADADVRENEAAKSQRQEERERAGNQQHQVYVFDKEVSPATVREAVAALSIWHREKPGCNIVIQITSPGGDIIAGFELVDYIRWLRAEGHEVTCVAYGYAASMGGVLLQAGSKRVMGKNALLLIHEGSLGVVGDYAKVQDMVALMKKMHEKILDLFMERATVTRRFIVKNWERRDWWITAEDALKYGFVDEIL